MSDAINASTFALKQSKINPAATSPGAGEKPRGGVKPFLLKLLRPYLIRLTLWLARLVGLPVMPPDFMMFSVPMAVKFGLNEAIVFQAVSSWLNHNQRRDSQRHYKDGKWWTYRTYGEWQTTTLKWMSTVTVGRVFREMEKSGLLTSAFYGKATDRTKWYSVAFTGNDHCIKEESSPRHIGMEGVSSRYGLFNSIASEIELSETKQQTPPPPTPAPVATGGGGLPTADSGEFLPTNAKASERIHDDQHINPDVIPAKRTPVTATTPPPYSAPPPAPEHEALRAKAREIKLTLDTDLLNHIAERGGMVYLERAIEAGRGGDNPAALTRFKIVHDSVPHGGEVASVNSFADDPYAAFYANADEFLPTPSTPTGIPSRMNRHTLARPPYPTFSRVSLRCRSRHRRQ